MRQDLCAVEECATVLSARLQSDGAASFRVAKCLLCESGVEEVLETMSSSTSSEGAASTRPIRARGADVRRGNDPWFFLTLLGTS